jgi:MFS family permease
VSSAASASPVPAPRLGPNPRVAVALLLLINLMNYVDRQVLSAVQSIIGDYFESIGQPHSKFAMGSLAAAFLISYMVMSPIFGYFADRYSRWKIVAIGVVVWSIASGASGLAAGYVMLLFTRIFVGIGEAAYGPSAPTIIADLYPVERRGSVLAWFYVAIPVGSAIGYVWGGNIAGLLDWRWAFYLSLPPGIALGIWALMMREPPRGGAEMTRPKNHSLWADYKSFFKIPSYVYNTLGMTAMTFALGGLAFWMPEYVGDYRYPRDQPAEYGDILLLADRANLTPERITEIMAKRKAVLGQVNTMFGGITVVAGLVATLVGGYLGDKLRNRWSGSYFLVSGVGMLLGVPLFLGMLLTPFPYAWGFVFFAEFCLFLNTGPANAVLANVTHPLTRASAFALNILIIHALGDVISPPLIGLVTDLTGGNMTLGFGLVTTAAIFFSGLFWMLGAKHLERDTALADTRIG